MLAAHREPGGELWFVTLNAGYNRTNFRLSEQSELIGIQPAIRWTTVALSLTAQIGR